ncbi:MAG: hypothetical protein H6582_03620 [Crocinitomicaceae bacterium]|nr:hypothetical protein [Crocinitomicaceae bacterium]
MLRITQILVCSCIFLYACNNEPCPIPKGEDSEWNIEEFTIIKQRLIGPVGPPFDEYSLCLDNQKIGQSGKFNTCEISFQPENDLYLKFNLCDSTLFRSVPEKKEINPDDLISAKMYSTKENREKSISKEDALELIEDWNNSSPSDYRNKPLDDIFHPNYQYSIIFELHSGVREFRAFNFLINDRTNWVYYISDGSDLEYFDRIWEKN